MKLSNISKSIEINSIQLSKCTQGLCGREILEICQKVRYILIVEETAVCVAGGGGYKQRIVMLPYRFVDTV